MESDTGIMRNVIDQIEKLIENKEFEKALQPIADSLKMEKWMEEHGTELILCHAYCQLMVDDGKRKDTIPIRQQLQTLNEQKILDLPPFYH